MRTLARKAATGAGGWGRVRPSSASRRAGPVWSAVMAEQAREQTTINASVEQCFRTLVDFERYPEWAGGLKEASVISRDDDERPEVVEYLAAAMGRSDHLLG